MNNHWFDSHAHLADAKFDPDRREAIERAFLAGVTEIVEIGEGPAEWEKARKLSELYPDNIWWALGLHPYYSDQLNPALEERMRQYQTHSRLVGIGEVGLDYAKSAIPREVQLKSLERLIDLAFEFQLPIIIHCREAYGDLVPLLSNRFVGGKSPQPGRPPGVIHCFSGSPQDAEALLSLGFYIGVDAPLTYPNAHSLREALASVPLEKIVLETDCPYLPPQAYRGKRNEPAYLPQVGDYLAQLRGISPDEVARITTVNAQALFNLKHP